MDIDPLILPLPLPDNCHKCETPLHKSNLSNFFHHKFSSIDQGIVPTTTLNLPTTLLTGLCDWLCRFDCISRVFDKISLSNYHSYNIFFSLTHLPLLSAINMHSKHVSFSEANKYQSCSIQEELHTITFHNTWSVTSH